MTEKRRVIPTPIGHIHESEGQVLCPVCLFDYSHVRNVFTRRGSTSEAVVYPGTQVKDWTGARRSALVVIFHGECGHRWEWVIQQEKGINRIGYNVLDPEPPGSIDYPDPDASS